MRHVARLAAMLFDEFLPLHGLGGGERELLVCAALLHDIGLDESPKGHHKHSMHLILGAPLDALDAREKLVVANVARYHRKALPSLEHRHFSELSPHDQQVVRKLAALLRIADGLDRLHAASVQRLRAARDDDGSWTLLIAGKGDLGYAAWGARRKADLFREAFGTELSIERQKT